MPLTRKFATFPPRGGGRIRVSRSNLLLDFSVHEEPDWARNGLFRIAFVDGFADDLIAPLKRTTLVEVSLNCLFPETKDWESQLFTDSGFIQAAYGPPDCELPILPENPGRLEDMRLEMCVRSTTQGVETLATHSKQRLARQLVQRYHAAALPELAELTDERSVTAVGSWVVICEVLLNRTSKVDRRY